jgi:hypothetical protein
VWFTRFNMAVATHGFCPSHLLIGQATAHDLFKKLWKSACKSILLADLDDSTPEKKDVPSKLQVCTLWGRSTRNTTIFVWDCDFAHQCWNSIVQGKNRWISFYGEVHLAGKQIHQKIHMEVTILGCWNIRNKRKRKIFKNERCPFKTWKDKYKMILLWLYIEQSKRRPTFWNKRITKFSSFFIGRIMVTLSQWCHRISVATHDYHKSWSNLAVCNSWLSRITKQFSGLEHL